MNHVTHPLGSADINNFAISGNQQILLYQEIHV